MNEINELRLKIKVEEPTPDIIRLRVRDPRSEKIKLDIRKALNGDYMIYDHPLYDIVVMPQKNKIVTFSKRYPKLDPYPHQDGFFNFLRTKGIIVPDTIQSGNVHGSLEATYPINDEVNTVDAILLMIFKYFMTELKSMKIILDNEEEFEEDLLDPSQEDSTEYGEIPQKIKKGTINPYYTDYYGLLYRI